MSDLPLAVTASLLAAVGFGVVAIPFALAKASARVGADSRSVWITGALLPAWCVATGLAAQAGFYQPRAGQPPTTLVALIVAIAVIAFGVRTLPSLRALLLNPHLQPALVWLQIWRLEGVVLLALFAIGKLPALFAVPAGLGDLAIGITAPLVARRLSDHGLLIIWNAFGLAVLIGAVTIVVTSSAGALQFFTPTPPVTPMTEFPLAIIPTFLIPISNTLHLSSLRYHLRGRRLPA